MRCGGWDALGEDASRVRSAVFVQEQKVRMDMEWDEADATAVHAVAYNRLGHPVATGRLLPYKPGSAKIGRMAVVRVLRGMGLGSDILSRLAVQARERGDREIVLHAQASARGFYDRQGFEPRGEPFEEVNIPHIEMAKSLD